ncbi:MAG: cyclic nucleotide-binding domain-containing protein [Verrucomicrobiales bacterium]|nr:cyclic nucleotide-binding domain-containing protein [Verrucomicrobiales bacterium]
METPNPPNTLPAIGLLKQLDENLRQGLSKRGRFETYMPGKKLAVQGEPHHTMSLILSGKVVVSVHAHGDYVELATLGAGETIGEMNMIDPQKASADVIVREKSDVWQIDQSEFRAIVDDSPLDACHILLWLGRQLCHRIRFNSEKMLRQAELMRMQFREMDY